MAESTRPHIEQVCSLLENFGVSDDPEWLAVLLFVRNLIVHLSVFDEDHKSDLQKRILKEMADKDLTPRRFSAIIGLLDAFILQNKGTQELEEALAREKRSSKLLLDEMNAIFDGLRGSRQRQEERLDDFSERTAEVVEETSSKTDLIKRMRAMVTEVVSEIREEAREWEERAKSLERTANYDPLLTELYNRRSLDAHLPDVVVRAGSRSTPLSLMMIDVDHFKRINDTFGHQVGDDVLRALAKVVTEHVRQYDGYAARYGGEELCVVLDGTGMAAAAERAENLRRDVEEYQFQSREGGRIVGDPLHFTISIGVAELEPGWSVEDLVSAADKALYRAKNSGRNLVSRFEGSGNNSRVSWTA